MRADLTYSPIQSDDEAIQLRDVLLQSFSDNERFWNPYLEAIGRENFRVLRNENEVVGGLALIPAGQWFGGRSIPMTGIAAVGIAPHLRGEGIASHLMQKAVEEIHASETPLSTLYPATVALYRKSGYELAGSRYIWSVPPASIGVRERELAIRPVTEKDESALRELADRRAAATSGNLKRNEGHWKMLRKSRSEPVYQYIVGAEKRPEGYVIFFQSRVAKGYNVIIHDMVALTPQAGRRLWSFLASHGAQSHQIRWSGPAVEPLIWSLPEPRHRLEHAELWMLRIVRVREALEQRGYPVDANEELHLEITDDLVSQNHGRFVMSVTNGTCRVTSGGRGDLKLDVRGLAPLYTGLLSPRQLALLGTLEGTPEATRAAGTLFGGPEPWMPDAF